MVQIRRDKNMRQRRVILYGRAGRSVRAREEGSVSSVWSTCASERELAPCTGSLCSTVAVEPEQV